MELIVPPAVIYGENYQDFDEISTKNAHILKTEFSP